MICAVFKTNKPVEVVKRLSGSDKVAFAVVEIFYDGKQKYTDFMNLYKFV